MAGKCVEQTREEKDLSVLTDNQLIKFHIIVMSLLW